ncbi:phytoene desaturase family protein [Micromonospora polyrhachis]|uniref:Pyridine nucleotide-disulfide oxidoreductase domain-containing protein 2 n=1 Tax=Micromonospora polyrhachis TaxID=1282883 RepID=A0A7W7SWK2_9ACTN|nr:NAD(P)/FAD-dependent oxidoreductase [Micromonospora polyrhachis]MBB4962183.1 phytoene dehydrogenase-like protein [Micromonospora polyrhachis]
MSDTMAAGADVGVRARVDAVVVGAGPNGLAAALVLAGAGLSVEVYEAADTIGGGTRTEQLTLPGFWHDVCSAVHPMALASPFFRAFDLAAHGVELLQPEIAYAHPLDGGRAGLAWRDLDRTVEGLGVDGPAWRSLLGPLATHWRALVATIMSDFRSVPRHPGIALRLGLRILEQGSPLWSARFRGEVAPALLTGVATHAIAPPRALAPAGAGLLLAALGHAVGWPLPRGGSAAITRAMAAELTRLGGRIVTGTRIDTLAQLPPARAVLLDVTPAGLLRIAGDALPAGYARQLRSFRYGGAVCKVDFALSGPVPWAAPDVDRAGTLHLVGSREEAVAAEQAVAAGRHAARPYVLAAQPGIVDDTRAPAGRQVLWTYAHVPNGSPRDVSDQVIAQVERFAPGFRDLILATNVITAAEASTHNANYVGGDISSGATTLWQQVMRPVPRWDPYRTPLPGVYLCSSSTPPGQAVHGMAGVHAAGRALRHRFGIGADPLRFVEFPESAESAVADRPGGTDDC